MAKDPAFLFYSSDFLSGVMDLTMEERGQFITILCLQHQKGRLNDKTIRLAVGSVSVDVLKKFKKDDQGNLFNERLEVEIEKRLKFTDSRRLNGSKGGKRKANAEPLAEPLGIPKKNLPENENINENEIDNTIEYVKITGQKDFTVSEVKTFWKAFCIQNKDNQYSSRERKIQHFRDWLKKQNTNGKINQSTVAQDSESRNREYAVGF